MKINYEKLIIYGGIFVILVLASMSIYNTIQGNTRDAEYKAQISSLSTRTENIINVDSLKSAIEKDFQLRLDSLDSTYTIKIEKLNHRVDIYRTKERQLEKELNDISVALGELPNF